MASKKMLGALKKHGISRAHHEYVDMDYVSKLSPEEKEWMGRFVNEYYQGSFTGTDEDLMKTQEEKRVTWQDSLARRKRDLVTVARAAGTYPYEFSEEAEDPCEDVMWEEDRINAAIEVRRRFTAAERKELLLVFEEEEEERQKEIRSKKHGKRR